MLKYEDELREWQKLSSTWETELERDVVKHASKALVTDTGLMSSLRAYYLLINSEYTANIVWC